MLNGFPGGHDRDGNFAVDEFFGFGGEALEVFEVDLLSYQHQVDAVAVAPHGQFAGDVGLGYVADAVDDMFNEAVNAGVFAQDAGDVGEQWVVDVGAKDLAVLFLAGDQQSSLLETVEFETDGVGAFAELFGQTSQMADGIGDEKKASEEAEAGFTGD